MHVLSMHFCVHERVHTRCVSVCLSGRMYDNDAMEASQDFILNPPSSLPLFFFFFSLLFALCHSFSWFDLRQNLIAQFHTLSAVDKGLTGCSRAPARDTACTQNGRKSNSSRQWGPFVELSRMKSPYLAGHCFSRHLPVSHCWPEKNKSLFERKKSCEKVFGP